MHNKSIVINFFSHQHQLVRCCFLRPKILAQSRPQSPRYLAEWVRVTALSQPRPQPGLSLKKMGGTGEGKTHLSYASSRGSLLLSLF